MTPTALKYQNTLLKAPTMKPKVPTATALKGSAWISGGRLRFIPKTPTTYAEKLMEELSMAREILATRASLRAISSLIDTLSTHTDMSLQVKNITQCML